MLEWNIKSVRSLLDNPVILHEWVFPCSRWCITLQMFKCSSYITLEKNIPLLVKQSLTKHGKEREENTVLPFSYYWLRYIYCWTQKEEIKSTFVPNLIIYWKPSVAMLKMSPPVLFNVGNERSSIWLHDYSLGVLQEPSHWILFSVSTSKTSED